MTRQPSYPNSRRVTGFSLVELMVALALSLILLAGVLAIFASSRTTYETTDRLARLQENGRFALDLIVRDLRSAGYAGCSKAAPFTNMLNQETNVMRNFAIAVQGYDAQATDWSPALDATVIADAEVGNDVLVVRRPRGDFEPVRVLEYVGYMKFETDPVRIPDVSPQLIQAGDIVQISDCTSRAVFEVTDNSSGVLTHDETAATPPAEGEEGVPVEPGTGNKSGSLGYAFTDKAEVVPVQTVIYFLRVPAGDTTPNLYRRVSGGGPAEPVVEGVEAMQVTYGVPVAGKIVYRKASEIGGDWASVQTVRIALLVRSLSEYGSDTDQQKYDLLGEEVPEPGDRRLRQVFTTTVDLRNAPTT